jgi:hypothetical protein
MEAEASDEEVSAVEDSAEGEDSAEVSDVDRRCRTVEFRARPLDRSTARPLDRTPH